MIGGMTRRDVLALGASLCAALAIPSCDPRREAAMAVPLRDRVRFGINHQPASLAARERALGYRFPIVGGTYYSFDTTWARHTGDLPPAVGRELMVCWMPIRVGHTVLLSHIPSGVYDDHLDQMLAGMRGVRGPVVCRWGHEPNGNWYPWAAAYGKSDRGSSAPTEYVDAWRYVVGRERSMPGTSNIRWFWCASGRDLPSVRGDVYRLEDYWPGEEWVDLVGCDAYNEPDRWDSFDAVFADPYDRISQLSHKPFWIGEVGCHEPSFGQIGDKGRWIEAMVNSTAFPNLDALCYFDYDARAIGRADWRLDSTRSTFASVITTFSSIPARA